MRWPLHPNDAHLHCIPSPGRKPGMGKHVHSHLGTEILVVLFWQNSVKMDGWKPILSFWDPACFQGRSAVSLLQPFVNRGLEFCLVSAPRGTAGSGPLKTSSKQRSFITPFIGVNKNPSETHWFWAMSRSIRAPFWRCSRNVFKIWNCGVGQTKGKAIKKTWTMNQNWRGIVLRIIIWIVPMCGNSGKEVL